MERAPCIPEPRPGMGGETHCRGAASHFGTRREGGASHHARIASRQHRALRAGLPLNHWRINMRQASAVAVVERLSDADLVQRILSGDMRAMETLMRLHNRMLYRTARAILRDDAEAEDAVQDAYLQAYRKLATFRGESKLSTWLVRITANEALMRRRRNPRPAEAPAHEEAVSERPGPQEEAERA